MSLFNSYMGGIGSSWLIDDYSLTTVGSEKSKLSLKILFSVYGWLSMAMSVLLQLSNRMGVTTSIALIFGFGHDIYAQDYNYYSQYMFNGLAINPAYAGINERVNITSDVRKQWFGIAGAPSTQTLSAHAPISNDKYGLGLVFVNDRVGVTYQQEFNVNYAYRIKFPIATLSLGLKAGINSVQNRFNELSMMDLDDSHFGNQDRYVVPSLGMGAYYKAENYYVGASIPQLITLKNQSDEEINTKEESLLLLTGGYVYHINRKYTIRPSTLMKTHIGSVFEMDINANLYYNEDFCVGLSYKSLNALSIMFEVGFQKMYYIGYSYDIATTSMIREQYGTHELSINIYLDRKGRGKVVNPRFF
ncbi:type IX secretion system membrane protein PorP/SprF [Bacteroidales bacterium]|nr:type IX secretion system membrane protein PorP/SprF [Bacteroidales bacterium]